MGLLCKEDWSSEFLEYLSYPCCSSFNLSHQDPVGTYKAFGTQQ